MKKTMIAVLALVIFGLGARLGHADPYSLQWITFNHNGDVQENDYTGINHAGWDDLTGLGSLVFTDLTLGDSFFDVFFDIQIDAPFWNEYGAIGGGPLAVGQTWEISDSFSPGGSYDDVVAGGPLPNTNALPGQVGNFLDNCDPVGINCNDDFAAAMGFGYHVDPGFKAIVTLTGSDTEPGGPFFVLGVHPQDPAHVAPINWYLSGNVRIVPADGQIPEPGTLLLLGTGILALGAKGCRVGKLKKT